MVQDGARQTINRMYVEYQENYEFLMGNHQIGFATDYKSQFSKVLLLSVASYFEVRMTEVLKRILLSDFCPLVNNFLERKALSRQYHTLFNWTQGESGVNQFFGFLGKDFQNFMKAKKELEPQLRPAIAAFMELGSARNNMVHGNYAIFRLDMTADDVKIKFDSALFFVDNLERHVDEFRSLPVTEE
ncbi:HEPN domain-containing protein [Vibrio fluvialis]|uniref:HEPN domain-containing protein n=1 Tax=Vibrio fluvialis TaxID=676 RepID=UPI001F1D05B5|nr:HEPN domain-containing protein [Vibrio fluvialis]MCE7656942.1 hypothetical protein [Vibrio fluvialis]